MKYSEENYSRYPFVYFKINPKLPDQNDQQKLFADFNKMLEMPEKAIVIFNTRDQKLISSEARIATAKWLNSIEDQMKNKVRCIFFIESSIWLNMILKAIFLIAKVPVPIHVLNSQNEVADLLKRSYNIDMPFRF